MDAFTLESFARSCMVDRSPIQCADDAALCAAALSTDPGHQAAPAAGHQARACCTSSTQTISQIGGGKFPVSAHCTLQKADCTGAYKVRGPGQRSPLSPKARSKHRQRPTPHMCTACCLPAASRSSLEVKYQHLSKQHPLLSMWLADEPRLMLDLMSQVRRGAQWLLSL